MAPRQEGLATSTITTRPASPKTSSSPTAAGAVTPASTASRTILETAPTPSSIQSAVAQAAARIARLLPSVTGSAQPYSACAHRSPAAVATQAKHHQTACPQRTNRSGSCPLPRPRMVRLTRPSPRARAPHHDTPPSTSPRTRAWAPAGRGCLAPCARDDRGSRASEASVRALAFRTYSMLVTTGQWRVTPAG
jgi:hypothetical protein